jgi:hypothetical protein
LRLPPLSVTVPCVWTFTVHDEASEVPARGSTSDETGRMPEGATLKFANEACPGLAKPAP